MKFLLLSHNLDAAIDWAKSQNVPNLFIVDEREVAKENPKKFHNGLRNLEYSKNICEALAVKVFAYKASRPLCVIMDMRHQSAIEKITNDFSILLYDHSLDHKIAYNPNYKADYQLNFDDKFPVDSI